MTGELVTVVVPIYNVERYLNRCVKSIVGQTYENLEIILVDDGSPDGCPIMCDEWAKTDGRIKVVHKINQGLGEARNTGLQAANGKYIFFFDSDDYVAADLVERCVTVAEAYGADTVVYGRNNIYSDGTVSGGKITVEKEVYEGQEIKSVLLPGLFSYSMGYGVSAWSKMYSMSIFKENTLRFPSERAVISEDSIFSLDYFAKASKVAVIPDRLYYYVRNDNSLTRTFKSDRQEKNNHFLKIAIDKVNESGLPQSIISHLESRYHGMVLGTIMQIVGSDADKKQKRKLIRGIYNDEVLRATLRYEVMAMDAFVSHIFWIMVKIRFYFICDILLFCKRQKREERLIASC